MAEGINKVCVIGSGVMGGAIAAHVAGIGIEVELLDIVPDGMSADAPPKERSGVASGGLARALKAKPAAFFVPEAARLVRVGNLEDHLARIADCDLIIEAIPESLKLKQSLFERIAPHVGEAAVLASNTSGLSIAAMNGVLPSALQERFVVMHFFNPVRYMHLLEVVPGPVTDPEVVARMVRFGEFLGKGIVFGKDTTNFVANRIGVYSMMVTLRRMLEEGLSIEEVDALTGRAMARPKSGTFQLADVVGLDTLIHVAQNCYDSLSDDPERDVFEVPNLMLELQRAGALGRKAGRGFYRKVGKVIEVLDVASGAYRAPVQPDFPCLAAAKKAGSPADSVRALVESDDAGGRFAWGVVARTLTYAASLVGKIADDVVNIDRAMRWGFNWELGPFELWDALGVAATTERMVATGVAVPEWIHRMLASGQQTFYTQSDSGTSFYDPSEETSRELIVHPRSLTCQRARAQSGAVVRSNSGASLLDLGDGVLGLELHTKMNTIDADVIAMVDEAVSIAEGTFEAIVVGNDSEHFSAGANLAMIAGAAQAGRWDEIDSIIAGLQQALQRLRYCGVPVVSAPCQYTLGGGAELAMASDATQAHAETYMGLVEVGVGLVPAGCGCLRLVERFSAPISDIEGADLLPAIAQASLNIAMARVSSSAEEARQLRYLRPADGISPNRDFLLFEAKARALGMARAGYRPPQPLLLKAAGYDAAKTIGARIWGMVEGRWASPHDALIAGKVAHILCGGRVAAGSLHDEQHFLELEREAFLQLCGEKKTHERIAHMLKTGKVLRN